MFRGVSCNFTQDDQLKSYWEGNTYMKTCKRCESRSCRYLVEEPSRQMEQEVQSHEARAASMFKDVQGGQCGWKNE